ncbi:MAG: hypothetical protein U5N55_02210 [Cypionkella sp.]|nr:hypothetical protein [Cypionkella sp.]
MRYIEYITEAARDVDDRALADALRRGLKSVEKTQVQSRVQSGRLDRRAITRTQTGAQDVYSRRVYTPGVTTSVLVMLDNSGSTNKHAFSNRSLLHDMLGTIAKLLPALDRAGARNAAAVHCLEMDHPQGRATIGVFKPWGQKTSTPRFIHDFWPICAQVSTPLGAEALWAQREMLNQRTERRVVLWLGDGKPNEPVPAMRVLFDQFAKTPVEHYGIGLACDLTGVYSPERSITVYDFKALPSAIEKMLTGGAK